MLALFSTNMTPNNTEPTIPGNKIIPQITKHADSVPLHGYSSELTWGLVRIVICAGLTHEKPLICVT